MATSVKELLAAANAAVPRITADELQVMAKAGNVLILDVRDELEIRQSGKIKGAVTVSRGMLEFRADPELPSHNPAFQKDKKIVVYCGSGGRAALSGKTLKDLGYKSVFNAGGFRDLAEAGVETEPV
ncbi:MAG: rhodanese-like domain-containing protein [Proteobacteria bacterium]|nr:rhodanese-like domain-containing protein [Pseudomonadota bacterium]MBI3497087.1 rhodanese-like domain-containing protein [Pseudomonadota bacterium]